MIQAVNAVKLHQTAAGNTLMFSELAQRLSQELQKNLPLLENLIPKKELHATLQAALGRLNLVTREEFDAQSAVLQRTRAKLEAPEQQHVELEQRCTEIEQQLSKQK